jgi:hypothetical protein
LHKSPPLDRQIYFCSFASRFRKKMSEKDEWMWTEFLKIGENLVNLRGEQRSSEALRAFKLAKELIAEGYLTSLPIKEQ